MFKQNNIASAMLMAFATAQQTLLDFETRQLQEVEPDVRIETLEILWSKLDKDQNGIVDVQEHLSMLANAELGGQIWSEFDDDFELNAYDFHNSTIYPLWDICADIAFKPNYNPFERQAYVPMGVKVDHGKREFSVEELKEA